MFRFRCVRRRQDATLQTGEIKYLGIRKDLKDRFFRIKELVNPTFRLIVPHVFVVCAVLKKQSLIVLKKWSRSKFTIVPDERNPSIWFQNSSSFNFCSLRIEPVKSLTCGNKVDCRIVEGRILRCSSDTCELGIVTE